MAPWAQRRRHPLDGARALEVQCGDGARRGWRAMVANAIERNGVAPAVVEREPPGRPPWTVSYPPDWPPDPDPGNRVTDWSRHWWTRAVFNPRCADCRSGGCACEPIEEDNSTEGATHA